ncbi:uncharacterized protein LOC119690093 [Teleopsis dalmanni]|uniref:uncharacterized protein LOC119690093 n=1 Tax=Teleopsis dalmanni TaxID=139649 RepID=UPI0018CF7325|nr:uncharacterized protein LOC119690093 [Teleopsis dalmanni]
MSNLWKSLTSVWKLGTSLVNKSGSVFFGGLQSTNTRMASTSRLREIFSELNVPNDTVRWKERISQQYMITKQTKTLTKFERKIQIAENSRVVQNLASDDDSLKFNQ